MKLLVSGATGFVGKFLCAYLAKEGHTVTKISRDLSSQAIKTGDCLIHLAGRAHVMHETAEDIYQAYAEVNIGYTLKVAEWANHLGIKRFVFLSSVKVNGEASSKLFTEADTPAPLDPYGQTKLEAEIALKDFCAANQMELVIIRPPLIYGTGVKANFRQLIKLCLLPLPMPFGLVNNKRSFISLDNLADFILLCSWHPQAANHTFLISDGEDVSTAELITIIRKVKQQRPWLIPVPLWILKSLFKLIGKSGLAQRLLGNLQVDISKAKTLLGWQPKLSFHDGIAKSIEES